MLWLFFERVCGIEIVVLGWRGYDVSLGCFRVVDNFVSLGVFIYIVLGV